MAFFELWYFTR